jgi:hypothetical protein
MEIFILKKLTAICTALFVSSFILGCNAGNTNTITASPTNCSPITTAAQCSIVLTYTSTNSSTLGVSYSPQQLQQFSLSTSSCGTPSSSSQTCTVPVSYSSTGTPVTENVTFTVGGATSNAITLSGN